MSYNPATFEYFKVSDFLRDHQNYLKASQMFLLETLSLGVVIKHRQTERRRKNRFFPVRMRTKCSEAKSRGVSL